jgi:bifunctional NMN adenylyltransferase/nudix hydrolase
MKYQSALIIGRFQPFHQGHLELITSALQQAQHVILVIGSARGPRGLRNPFTAAERIEMLKANKIAGEDRLHFVEVRDYFYNNAGWINEVREKVREKQVALGISTESGHTAIVGHQKDESSSYLTWFPDWSRLEIASLREVNATPIRQAYLREAASIETEKDLSPATKQWLQNFAKSTFYQELKAEQIAIDAYKKSWSVAPYPPVFVTTDVLLVCNEHILLIQRKHAPGKGLWANPGGFLDGQEMILDCALRELAEETALQVPEKELRESLAAVRVFDHPLRSSRGRTITHAHLFHLKRAELPAFKASDDAMNARWVPLLDIGKMESELFEDHFHIINLMLRTSHAR